VSERSVSELVAQGREMVAAMNDRVLHAGSKRECVYWRIGILNMTNSLIGSMSIAA
jgi:hypothetical protein